MVHFSNKQVDREKYILKNCKNKNILNIGCLAADKKAVLHQKIERTSKKTLGMDIFDAKFDNYIKGDAQNFYFEDKFDVIIVGEVIEHIWNMEGLFRSSFRSLADGGKLIITTPNAYAPIFIKNAIFGKIVPNDPHHVVLFDVTTLKNLLNNFANELFGGEIFYYKEASAQSVSYKMQSILESMKNGFSRGLIAELKKA